MKASGVSHKSIVCDRTIEIAFEVNVRFALREIFEWPTDDSTWSLRPKCFDRVLVLVGDSTMISDLAIVIELENVPYNLAWGKSAGGSYRIVTRTY